MRKTKLTGLENWTINWQDCCRLLLLSVLLLVVSVQTAADSSVQFSDDDLLRLQRGEVLLEQVHESKPGGAVRASALFYTNAETLWDIIGYCKYAFVYVRGLKLCEVIEPGLTHTVRHHRLRNSWYSPTLDFTFEASRRDLDYGEFHLVDGDFKIMEGQWEFVSLPDSGGIIGIHELRIQPKIPAPKSLLRYNLKKNLPAMLACMRGLARASGDNRRIAKDLNRCPGEIPAELK